VTNRVCLTIDVEDFYEGLAVLGEEMAKPPGIEEKLDRLVDALGTEQSAPKVTLFVVGRHAPSVLPSLIAFASAGHEIASHGPDHGRLPADGLVGWLRSGRQMLEDLLQVPVRGFRSPRFDLPPHGDLSRYRDEIAEAGYDYVSDASRLDEGSPVREAPVMAWRGVRLGGGSYQRAVPYAALNSVIRRFAGTAVCYYHSYDFDGTTPGLKAVRSALLAREVIGRARIEPIFMRLARRFGSETCFDAAI
jgi:peptidoglycan/xylan/chitin deacetylase (PgdA/CDA1 family)